MRKKKTPKTTHKQISELQVTMEEKVKKYLTLIGYDDIVDRAALEFAAKTIMQGCGKKKQRKKNHRKFEIELEKKTNTLKEEIVQNLMKMTIYILVKTCTEKEMDEFIYLAEKIGEMDDKLRQKIIKFL